MSALNFFWSKRKKRGVEERSICLAHGGFFPFHSTVYFSPSFSPSLSLPCLSLPRIMCMRKRKAGRKSKSGGNAMGTFLAVFDPRRKRRRGENRIIQTHTRPREENISTFFFSLFSFFFFPLSFCQTCSFPRTLPKERGGNGRREEKRGCVNLA